MGGLQHLLYGFRVTEGCGIAGMSFGARIARVGVMRIRCTDDAVLERVATALARDLDTIEERVAQERRFARAAASLTFQPSAAGR